MDAKKPGLFSPWVVFCTQLGAFFKEDPDVRIEFNEKKNELKLFVNDNEKGFALSQLLPTAKVFGNVVLKITVIPANEDDTNASKIEVFKTAFKNNGAVSYIKHVDVAGYSADYIVFKPVVVQYRNDDLSDINGICSTLYADLAREIFGEEPGLFYCTDMATECVGKPLGEWP